MFLITIEMTSETQKYEEIARKYADMEVNYKKLFDQFTDVTNGKSQNDRDLIKLESENKSLTTQLEDKQRLIVDKDKRLDIIERDLDTASKNFKKAKSKVELCSNQINAGNEHIAKIRNKNSKLKKELKEVSQKYEEIKQRHDQYYRASED